MSNKLSEGFGVVQLGVVKSYAKWRIDNEQWQISFEMQSLSLDKQQNLENYRNSPDSLKIYVPGHGPATSGTIIGFERAHKTAKFYVSRGKPAHDTHARIVTCPTCDSSDVAAFSTTRDYSVPDAKLVYVYKCKCGAGFVSSNPPDDVSRYPFRSSRRSLHSVNPAPNSICGTDGG